VGFSFDRIRDHRGAMSLTLHPLGTDAIDRLAPLEPIRAALCLSA
jgi:hypothetical protein